jgi:hypothetical protein
VAGLNALPLAARTVQIKVNLAFIDSPHQKKYFHDVPSKPKVTTALAVETNHKKKPRSIPLRWVPYYIKVCVIISFIL